MLSGAIAWYTFNVARVAWREQNRAGAYLVGLLALLAFALPTALLLLPR